MPSTVVAFAVALMPGPASAQPLEWTRQSPRAAWQPAMEYDQARGVTVLFGGSGSGSRGDDTWTLSQPCEPPSISGQPAAVSVCPGGQAPLSVGATGTAPRYRWRRDGVDLSDEPGSRTGTATGTLTIAAATAADAGRDDGVVTNACGNAVTTAAVPVVCAADYNCDGFLDFFDYDDYLRCFEGAVCPPGRTADFNGDGFADFLDYADFVGGFEAGC